MNAVAEEVTDQMVEEGLPTPVGYKLLIALPKSDETFGDSGILKPEMIKKQDEVATVIGLVLDMGPDAYNDKEKFPNGPWCKVGDYIIIRTYSGTRFKLYGQEYRLINDDTVEGIVSDPRGYSRA